jgi:cation:H+ antiporter
MVSSNINQWTLLAAMLPIVYSVSRGAISPIPFDDQQKLELLMTLGQSLVGILFLVNMKLSWWEASTLFFLWFTQFAFSPVKPGPGFAGYMAIHIHWIVTVAYFLWFALGLVRYARGGRRPEAFRLFAALWREHIRPPGNTAVR